jgi:maleylpyruvate isomerase
MQLALYTFWRSSSAYRVRIALAHKNIPYEARYVNLLENAQRTAEYRKTNPIGHVPALVVDGHPFVESVAIVELLEELFPEPALYPKDPLARAQVRGLVETINAGTQPLQNTSVLQRIGDDLDERAAWARHFIARGLDAFEQHMARHAQAGIDGPFAYGKTFSAADAWLVPQVYNARRYEVDLSPLPRVVAAEAAARATDAVRAAMPEAQGDADPDAP